MLEVKNLSVSFGKIEFLHGINFSVEAGQWLMIVGPNGAGKSTILKAISQSIPYSGLILCHGKDAKRYKPHEYARNIGFLMQSHSICYPFTVEEVVNLGRYAYAPGIFSRPDPENQKKVAQAVEMTGIEGLLKNSALTLSGGELQRTFLAQLFAQDPQILLLDEPTNHLDLLYQKQIFALIQDWLKETKRAVISIVHDLSLAKAYGSHGLLIDRGQLMATGNISQALTDDNLNSVYGMDVQAWMDEMYASWQK